MRPADTAGNLMQRPARQAQFSASDQNPAEPVFAEQGSTDPDPAGAAAWSAILAASRIARSAPLPGPMTAFAADGSNGLRAVGVNDPAALIVRCPQDGWAVASGCPTGMRDLLDLYLPVLAKDPWETFTIGHLGQSLDGYIATRSGDSCFVTGPENIWHLHRMRALCDAVVAGAETVVADDPRLTTRLVAGASPVRVVLDPRRRLAADLRVFDDGAAPTLLVCANGLEGTGRHGQAEVMGVPAMDGRLELHTLVARLQRRGLNRLFIEGGGLSVSAFLSAGLLDRLQVTVAPILIGEGRRGVSLPAAASLDDCLRPPCRLFRMGWDILFDCEPRLSKRRNEADCEPPVRRIL
jgi:diaminohydroxyphosphoribosylaminopyrimidine deaminase / 5-amino-6-(5-phosphoribosylamino)uracil reductase